MIGYGLDEATRQKLIEDGSITCPKKKPQTREPAPKEPLTIKPDYFKLKTRGWMHKEQVKEALKLIEATQCSIREASDATGVKYSNLYYHVRNNIERKESQYCGTIKGTFTVRRSVKKLFEEEKERTGHSGSRIVADALEARYREQLNKEIV